MVERYESKFVFSVIRWIGLLPVVCIAYISAYFVLNLLYGFGPGRFLDVTSSYYLILREWSCSFMSGGAATYVAALTAPTHKKHASVIFTILLLIFSIIAYFGTNINSISVIVSIIATIVGAITISAAILYNHVPINKSYQIDNNQSEDNSHQKQADLTDNLRESHIVNNGKMMQAKVKTYDFATSQSRTLCCPVCDESYPVPQYGKIVMTCYKCKTRFEHD